MNYPKWIDEFSESLYPALHGHDPRSHLPFNPFNFYPLYADLWANKLYNAIIQIDETKFKQLIDSPLPNTSSWRFALLLFVGRLNHTTISNEKIRTIADFFVKVLKQKVKNEDLFTKEKNIVHTDKQIETILNNTPWIKADKNFAQLLGKLNVALTSLSAGLYNDASADTSLDFQGTYNTNKKFEKDSKLLIRDFTHLKPKELLLDAKKFPHDRIMVYSIYNKIDFPMVYVSCHTQPTGNVLENLLYCAVEVDGKFLNQKQTEKLAEKYLLIASNIFVKAKKRTFEKQKEFFLKQESYQLKELFAIAGMNWKPTKEFLEAVRGKQLPQTVLSTYEYSFEDFNKNFGVNRLKEAYSNQK